MKCKFLKTMVLALMVGFGPMSGAWADNNADEAEVQFQLGARAYQDGDYWSALEHFLQSNRLVPNRNVLYNIARSFEQIDKDAEAYRYYVDARVGAPEDDQKEIDKALERLAKKVAVIQVVSDPPGASIYVGRKDLGSVGQTPRPLGLAPGEHKIIVEMEGYRPATSDAIKVGRGESQDVNLKLEPITGRVSFKGDPADVRVDSENSEPICRVPCETDLIVGMRTLIFSMEGRATQSRQLIVEEGEAYSVDVALPIPMGSVLVTADETEASIEIDGKLRGFTPAVIPNLPAGKHQLRVTRRGFKPVTMEIVVKQGEQLNLDMIEMIPLREVAAASRNVEAIEDAPASISVISAQEIEAFQYPTIYEALRGTRGVSLANDSIYGMVSIRGLGQPNDMNNRLLLLSDGAILNDNILYQAFIGYDGRVDLGEVQSIEVIRGPGSVIYGTGAVSGVVNLVPHAREEPTALQASFGTFDAGVGRGRAGFVLRNDDASAGVRGSVSAARSEGRDGELFFDLDGDGTTEGNVAEGIDTFDAVSTSGRAWVGPLSAQWHYSHRDIAIPTGSFDTVFNDPRNRYVDQNMMAELRLQTEIAKDLEILARGRANLTLFDLDYLYEGEGPSGEEFLQPYVEVYEGLAVGGEARLSWRPIETLRLSLGSELTFNPMTKMEVYQTEFDRARTDLLDVNPTYNVYAFYGLVDWKLAEWARVSAGARMDVWDRSEGESFSSVNPRLALILKPSDGHNVKVMGGRAFRAPSVYELFYTDGSFTTLPSACCGTLTPETFYQAEVEYSWAIDDQWTLLASAHGLLGQNFIGTLPVPNDAEGRVYFGNIEEDQRILGFDLEIRRDFRRGWMFAATAGVLDAQYLEPPASSDTDGTRVPNAPRGYGSLKAVVPAITNRLYLASRLTLETPRRILLDADTTTDWAVIADMVMTGRIEEYGVKYAFGVYNLFDWTLYLPVDPFVSRTMPQQGRSFMANLSLEY